MSERALLSRWFVIAVAFLAHSISALGQTSAPMTGPALYKNFVGNWVGTCCDFKGSDFPPSPAQLVVTIERDGKSMRWENTYSSKGKKDTHETRFVTLDPGKGEMTMRYKEGGADIYKTQELDRFAQTGLGRFSGSLLVTSERRVSHVVFNLEPTRFSYEWTTTTDGKDYKVTGLFTFARVPDSSSTTK